MEYFIFFMRGRSKRNEIKEAQLPTYNFLGGVVGEHSSLL